MTPNSYLSAEQSERPPGACPSMLLPACCSLGPVAVGRTKHPGGEDSWPYAEERDGAREQSASARRNPSSSRRALSIFPAEADLWPGFGRSAADLLGVSERCIGAELVRLKDADDAYAFVLGSLGGA